MSTNDNNGNNEKSINGECVEVYFKIQLVVSCVNYWCRSSTGIVNKMKSEIYYYLALTRFPHAILQGCITIILSPLINEKSIIRLVRILQWKGDRD